MRWDSSEMAGSLRLERNDFSNSFHDMERGGRADERDVLGGAAVVLLPRLPEPRPLARSSAARRDHVGRGLGAPQAQGALGIGLR